MEMDGYTFILRQGVKIDNKDSVLLLVLIIGSERADWLTLHGMFPPLLGSPVNSAHTIYIVLLYCIAHARSLN